MLDVLAALIKALLYAAALSCAGVVFAEASLGAPPGLEKYATRFVRRSAVLTIGACAVANLVLVLRLGGQWNEVTLSAVFMSATGAATCLLLTGTALLLASLEDPSARAMRVSSAAPITLSFAFNSHAGAEGLPEGLLAFVHTSAVAWWLGSLWLLRQAGAWLWAEPFARLVQRFSAIAAGLVGGLVLAGFLLIYALDSFLYLPAFSAYERVLAVKLGLFAVLVGLASYNRLRLTPRVRAGEPAARLALRRTVDAELALVGAILLTTAFLTTFLSPE